MSSTEQNKSGSSKGLTIALLVLLVGFGGLIAYLYSEKSALETTVANQESELDTTKSEIEELTADLESKKAEYESLQEEYAALGIENEELNAQIEELNSDIQRYKNINTSNKSEVRKARKDIEALNKKHAELLASKDAEIQHYKLKADSLASSVDSLLVEQNEASMKIQDLASKVQLASKLKAENIVVSAYNSKDKQDSDGSFKAKSTVKLKGSFTFEDNQVAKHEEKEVVFRLIQPDGSVIFDLATGGGSFTDANGKTDFYTSKQAISFNNSMQTVEFYYIVPSGYSLAKGDYNIEFYADGHNVGNAQFLVK